jgi:DNA-binding response OmpR family regulator
MNGSPYCRRCGAEIATANLLDLDPGIDRAHVALILPNGRRRQLAPADWRLFTVLYGRHGRIVPSAEIETETGIPASAVREHVHRLRPLLTQSRFQIITHRAHGFELIVRDDS